MSKTYYSQVLCKKYKTEQKGKGQHIHQGISNLNHRADTVYFFIGNSHYNLFKKQLYFSAKTEKCILPEAEASILEVWVSILFAWKFLKRLKAYLSLSGMWVCLWNKIITKAVF